MPRSSLRKALLATAVFLGAWLAVKYLLPIVLPFVLGTFLAMAAEPTVSFGSRRLRLPRALAAGVGVTVTLLLFAAILSVFAAFAVKELGYLAGIVPDLEQTARSGMVQMQDWMIQVADKTPEGVRPLLTKTVLGFFDGGAEMLEQATRQLPGMMTSALGWVSDGALVLGTGIIAGFMISARLPKLKRALSARLPEPWKAQCLPALHRMRGAMKGWLRAQAKLVVVTYGIVTVGFLLLRVPYGPLWALAVALVDAVPLLGTGTVLIPWALVWMLQGQNLQAVGLLCIYIVTFLTRSTLEPRLVGRHLGLDPLAALLALYVGYQFWGILGMLLSPILATAAKSMIQTGQ